MLIISGIRGYRPQVRIVMWSSCRHLLSSTVRNAGRRRVVHAMPSSARRSCRSCSVASMVPS